MRGMGSSATIQTVPPTGPVLGEADEVYRWRLGALERAGYGTEQARDLARRADVDLHRAVALLERGCPPELAYRILV